MFSPPALARVSALAPAVLVAIALSVGGCGPGNPGGPAMTGSVNEEPRPTGPDERSNDIMMRDAQANRTRVKHIVVGKDKKDLAVQLLGRVRAGEPIERLMEAFSSDPGSAKSGEAYDVTPDADLVFEFKRLALRLKVGEAGLIESEFGWHVMKRIE
ncbi:MAG TPA: peptidylprolyl isomerase [Kofleriaceae bacterium]|nr:peptidylprolyl isomerase [Kofleriaceae bacterium]